MISIQTQTYWKTVFWRAQKNGVIVHPPILSPHRNWAVPCVCVSQFRRFFCELYNVENYLNIVPTLLLPLIFYCLLHCEWKHSSDHFMKTLQHIETKICSPFQEDAIILGSLGKVVSVGYIYAMTVEMLIEWNYAERMDGKFVVRQRDVHFLFFFSFRFQQKNLTVPASWEFNNVTVFITVIVYQTYISRVSWKWALWKLGLYGSWKLALFQWEISRM